jgi:hypothetical protein
MDEAPGIIQQLMALVGIGDKGWTDTEQWRLEEVAEQARNYLEQIKPQQPVPIGERLPRPEDCDAEDRCWWWNNTGNQWDLIDVRYRTRAEFWVFTHWLPCHGLPIPAPRSEENLDG